MREFPRKLSILLLIVLFCVCVYRANTQSFAVDEAFAFNMFVNVNYSKMFQQYDACNHVLHTALTKIFRGVFGTSELVLRLASLIGAAMYFAAVYRLTLLLFGGRWVQVLAAALLALNPLVLDFLVASRGYALALGLLLWAVYSVCCYFVRGHDPKWLRWAGVCAGLSIGANLTMVVPAAALGMAVLVMVSRERKWWTVIDAYGGPAVVIAFITNVLPLVHAQRQSFYYGAHGIREALDFLTAYSLVTRPDEGIGKLIRAAVPVIGQIVIPALLVLLAVVAAITSARFLRERAPAAPYRLAPVALFSLTTAFAVLLLLALHYGAGVLLPLGRTGLYLVPLGYLTLLAWGMRHPKTVYPVVVLLVVAHLAQFETRFFVEWRWDASVNKLVDRMTQDHGGSPEPPVAVNASGMMAHALRYYQVRRGLKYVKQINTDRLDTTPAQYYFLTTEDRDIAGRLGLQVLMDDPLSGSLLAVRR